VEITRVPVPVATSAPGGETNAYLLGGDDALLVDPADDVPDIERRLDRVGHVAVTHHHPDHVGGVAACADRAGATVWARAGRTDAFEAATGLAPDRTFREGTPIPTGDGAVTVLETPGHVPEHVAFDAGGVLAVGDLAIAEGSVAVLAPEGDMRAYLTSLRRLHARRPDRLLPGHGPLVERPRAVARRLLGHRLDRERRVLAAVHETGGAATVAEVTDAAYEKDVSAVRAMAEATVRAHLEKLAVEGRLRFDGERAAPA
jgi:glyoxylase-like metal-dependent hydrolase (beta-lactamase superfamily II)